MNTGGKGWGAESDGIPTQEELQLGTVLLEMNRRHLPLPFLAAAALAVGCGGESGSPDADPAAIAPAGSALYAEMPLKLDDERSADVKALSQKLLGIADPGAELKKAIEKAGGAGRGESWDKDIEPVIGDRAAVFFTKISSGDDSQGALVAPLEDTDKAWEQLKETDEGEKKTERKHRDVAYVLDEDGDASAVVDDYAVVGTEGAVKAAIDTAKGGDALDGAEAFEKARDQVEDEALGFGYLRFEQLLAAAGPEAAALRPVLGQLGEGMALSLDAEDSTIEVEAVQLGVKGGAAGAGDPGAVLPTLPGDAWLAAGVKDVGGQVDQALNQIGQLGAFGGFDLDQVLEQVQDAFGIDVRKDLAAWMGDAGIFVRGSSLNDIGGGLVVQSKDPAATKAVVPKLQRFIRAAASGDARVSALRESGVDAGFTVRASDVPLPIHVAAAGDKFIVAVTDAALQSALKPSAPLSDGQAYKDATAKLGDGLKPALVLDPAPLASLLDGLGLAQQGPEAAKILEVLGKLSTVAAGGKREGDTATGKLVVGVK